MTEEKEYNFAKLLEDKKMTLIIIMAIVLITAIVLLTVALTVNTYTAKKLDYGVFEIKIHKNFNHPVIDGYDETVNGWVGITGTDVAYSYSGIWYLFSGDKVRVYITNKNISKIRVKSNYPYDTTEAIYKIKGR